MTGAAAFDWTTLQANIIGAIAVATAAVVPMAALVALVIRQYASLTSLWAELNRQGQQVQQTHDAVLEHAAALDPAHLDATIAAKTTETVQQLRNTGQLSSAAPPQWGGTT